MAVRAATSRAEAVWSACVARTTKSAAVAKARCARTLSAMCSAARPSVLCTPAIRMRAASSLSNPSSSACVNNSPAARGRPCCANPDATKSCTTRRSAFARSVGITSASEASPAQSPIRHIWRALSTCGLCAVEARLAGAFLAGFLRVMTFLEIAVTIDLRSTANLGSGLSGR